MSHPNWISLSLVRITCSFRVSRISQLHILWKILTPWTLRQNPISPACTHLSHHPRFMTMRWRLGKRPLRKLRGVRKLRFVTTKRWSCPILSYLCQSVYQSPCFAFHRSWIPPQGTWKSSISCSALALTCSVHSPGFVERRDTSVILVLISTPA